MLSSHDVIDLQGIHMINKSVLDFYWQRTQINKMQGMLNDDWLVLQKLKFQCITIGYIGTLMYLG